VFAAWFNHVDAKSINTIDTLIVENGHRVVRHYLLDFGSTLGSAGISPRDYWEGYEYLLEPGSQIGKGIAAFGFYILPWRMDPFYESRTVGRLPLDNTEWDPEKWRPRVANAASIRSRLDDKFWAARKAMAITDGMIRVAVAEGKFGDPAAARFLARTLIDRRNSIGRRYLPAINPIVDPALDASGVLTFGNAAVEAKFAAVPESYKATWSTFDNATGKTTPIGETTSKEQRVQAPIEVASSRGVFIKVELSAISGNYPTWAQPVTTYFRRQSDRWQLVGFERMP
jgi:hypothetical protein